MVCNRVNISQKYMSYIKYLYVFLIGHFDLCRFPHDSYFEHKDSENIMLRIDTQNIKIHYETRINWTIELDADANYIRPR
jgi:hypothetical protein